MDELADSELMAAARAGDREAFATLFARHFDAAYDFSLLMTGDVERASRVAADAFVEAMESLGGTRDSVTFRSLVFGAARREALAEAGSATRPGVAEVEGAAEAVRGAASRLDPKQLSLLDLHLRQGLDSDEIAAVLGIGKANAAVMLARLEKVAGSRLAGAAGADEDTRRLALAVYQSLEAVSAPSVTKERVLSGLLLRWPGRGFSGGGGRGADSRAPTLEEDRQKAAAPAVALGGVRLAAALAIVAGLFGAALLLPASPIALTRSNGASHQPAAAVGGETPTRGTNVIIVPERSATPNGSPTPAATGGSATASATPSPGTPTKTPPPGSTPTPTGTALPTPTSTPTPEPGATATPTRPPTPCVPALSTNLGILNVPLALGSSSFQLLNTSFGCGAASFAISSSEPWLTLSPASGGIGAGGAVSIVVTIAAGQVPAAEGTYSATASVNSGAAEVTVTTQRGGQPPHIVLAGGSCSQPVGPPSFAASASDDVAVIGVQVLFDKGGTPQGPLSLIFDGALGLWTGGPFDAATGGTNFRIVATDGIGLSDSRSIVPSNC